MDLNKYITIVIPCKNEKDIILKTLDLLNYQSDIYNVKVIVCDKSNDNITNQSLINRMGNKSNNDVFDLYVIDGGLPAKARNNGFKLVTTPYVLFIDADVFLLDSKTIKRAFLKIYKNNLDLVTTKFRSDNGKYNYIYKTFDFLQIISKWSTPFCLGGFMMIKSKTFTDLGGFDEEIKIAEDYQFSKQIKPRKFGRINNVVFTPPRRFENKGILYMTKLFLGSFFNNNNKPYFTKDNDYWS
jgi:cellulose synthase/poly-beta-1,6-N-acetylglucosamine synthase-like glycosyltransferase